MLNAVTSWWGGEKTDEKAEAEGTKLKADSSQTTPNDESQHKTESEKGPDEATNADKQEESNKTDQTQMDLDEVSAKALNTAKEWGSYLYSFGKAATQQVAKTAKQIKDTVEEKTILGEFTREQEKFVTEKKDKKKGKEAAVAPWVGYNEEEAMKSQIMALSSDKRNFLRNPPAGVQFQFDFETFSPVAAVMLQEDPNLDKMRFELVPKQVSEEAFWNNYFYRVSLIKQSTQLTSLAQQTGSTGDNSENAATASAKRDSIPKERPPASSRLCVEKSEEEDTHVGSPSDHEFISDAFQQEQISDEELKKEMQQLGMTEDQAKAQADSPEGEDNIAEWEKELQAELQEYEVVGDAGAVDDVDLENEILKQIEAEAEEQKS